VTKRNRLLVLLALAKAGCSPIAEAEFSDIEVSRPDISIPGAPAGVPSSVTFSFSLDSASLGANKSLVAQSNFVAVDLHRLSLTAKTGITSLSFVETLHALACVPISKSSKQSSRQVEIADYRRRTEQPASATFEVPIPEPVDLLPLLRPSSTEPYQIVVIVNIGGQLPTAAWTADALMALSIALRQ
jgi:hypothetical protein